MFFVVHKKNILLVLLLAMSGLFFGSFLASVSRAGCNFERHKVTVLLDPGHGLPDGGAVGINGTVEQEINLKIAKKISEVLEAKGISVIMTRYDENGIWSEKSKTIKAKKIEDMRKRLSIMKKSDADLFLSIHMNYFPDKSASGLHIFYTSKFSNIKPLAENIQARMADITGAKMHIVKTPDRSLYLLNNATIPAILIECGFLSNPEEEKKLTSDDYQSRLAWAVSDAIEKYYALKY